MLPRDRARHACNGKASIPNGKVSASEKTHRQRVREMMENRVTRGGETVCTATDDASSERERERASWRSGRVDDSRRDSTGYKLLSGSLSSWISRLIQSEKTSFSGSQSFKTKSVDGSKRPMNTRPLTIRDYNGCARRNVPSSPV